MPLFNEEMLMLLSGRESSFLIRIFRNPIVKCLQVFFEFIVSIVINLPIPLYSTLMKMMITSLPGSPSILGCYIRAIYYKPRVRSMGVNVLIDQFVVISHPKGLSLSDFAYIDKYVTIASKNTHIGRRVHIAPYTIITGGGDFVIEDYAGISNSCSIITSTETLKDGTRAGGPMIPLSQRDVLRGKVVVKKDAFLGTRSTVMTNVIIEEGSVVGAGVVMTKNTEKWKVYVLEGGRPKILRERMRLDLPDL